MVDVRQYTFTYEEVVVALVKQLDIYDGLWALNVNFSFNAKNIPKDTNPPHMKPGFHGALEYIGLVRVDKGIPGLTVDAAKANPQLTRDPTTKVH
jgi:hypothetical protein